MEFLIFKVKNNNRHLILQPPHATGGAVDTKMGKI
jgi:hypothetical protein